MRISTIENVLCRFQWLTKITEGEITLTKSEYHAISDMGSFCSLSVPGHFDKISYNSLKNLCIQNGVSAYRTPIFANQWEQIKILREQAHEKFNNLFSTSVQTAHPDHVKLRNEALILSHLSSVAYLEIFRFLKSLLENDSTLSEPTKLTIANFLLTSKAKFEHITSPLSLNTSRKTWLIIKGGKSHEKT